MKSATLKDLSCVPCSWFCWRRCCSCLLSGFCLFSCHCARWGCWLASPDWCCQAWRPGNCRRGAHSRNAFAPRGSRAAHRLHPLLPACMHRSASAIAAKVTRTVVAAAEGSADELRNQTHSQHVTLPLPHPHRSCLRLGDGPALRAECKMNKPPSPPCGQDSADNSQM